MLRDIEYLENKDIVRLRTSGTYELEAEVGTLVKMASTLKECSCNRCLFDHRETDVIARTISSYERSALYDKIWGDRSTRAAIVFKELNASFRFLETTVRNRGWNLRIFDDYDAAVNWLSE